ncbi:hypothetical protein [Polaribacter sp. HL-MS24]|uniref:hypothetical protein n=1 Tax=Polaribacter sp. HL-MS24 TaxID=3077735 RepID=UPI0029349D7F|nr:hypothetical protein [Polaribacter sp. HL-MS24]WOC40730.1 hypothetical protein RRF69_02785 [Polaribacter sp. HL-MS24]
MELNLKKITEKKIGFNITNLNDSKRLSEIMLITHDLSLNYNTIRRFFGVVKSVKASNYTLDTLAIFNGYKSYNDFLIKFGLQFQWKSELLVIELIHEKRNKELLKLINEEIHLRNEFYIIFIQIIRELILIKNYKLLVKIFKLKQTQQIHFSFDSLILIGMSIGKLLKKINLENTESHKLLLLKNFQDLVITINVDYSNLNTYYEKVISLIYKNSKRKHLLEFCKGVLNVNIYLQNKIDQQFHTLTYDDNFHPILKSRIYSQHILKNKIDIINTLENYFILNKREEELPIEYFFEIIFSSILTKNFKVMDWIIKKVNSHRNYNQFFKFEHYQNFIFMKLLFLRKNNDSLSIDNILEYFTFNDFNRSYRGVIDQYIYIFKHHTNNFNKENNYLDLYLINSKRMNLPLFTEKYLLTYFD